MKFWTSLRCLALCLALLVCFAGCGDGAVETTDPTEETQPPVDPRVLYEAARQAVESAPNLRLVISMEEQRTVGDETYTQSSNTVASYTGLNTEAFAAAVEENLTFGTYENIYKTFYFGGTAYAQIMDYAFSSPMTVAEFSALQIPAMPLDADLYETVTYQTGLSGTTIYFSDSTALESWITKPAQLELVSAEGTALVSKSGALLSSAYSASYKMGEVSFSLSVTVTVSTPENLDLTSQYPEELSAAAPIRTFTAPRSLLQAVGDICATHNLTASYTESLFCEAADSIRKQQVQVSTQGADDSFSATVDYTATLTNYAGMSSTNTQQETFADGAYTYSLNGSKPTVLQTVTVQQMRTYCEDTVLSALLSIDYLSGAELTDNGTTYTLQFTGTEAMAEDLCDSIYTMLNMDLDSTADSYQTNRIGGYLTIDKATGLPIGAGIFLTRTHVIGGASYTMTYEMNETISLPVQ